MSRLPAAGRNRTRTRRRRGRTVAAMALALIGATFALPARRRRRPGRRARATSTPPPATPASPPTAPRARCTPSYNGPLYQVLRQSDGKTLDIGVVAAHRASDAGGYADAAAQDAFCANTYLLDHHHLRPVPQAQRPHPGAARRLQRPGHGRLQQPPDRRHGADHDHGPQGLRRLHRAGHGPAPERRRRAPRSTTRPRASTGSSTASTTTPAAASTTATPRSTAATTATAPWRPPTTATPPPGITATPPGPWIMTDQENNLVGCVNPDSTPSSAPTCRASPGAS